MKVLLINNQFSIGGAARVATTQCNELKRLGVDLHVVTDNINWSIDYDLDKNIPVYSISVNPKASSKLQKILKAVKCIRDIRKYIKEICPDIIVAIQSDMYLRTLLAKMNIQIPLIVADHTSFSRKQDKVTNYTRYNLYKYADGISILTYKDKKLLGTKYPQKKVIYNPLTFDVFEGCSMRRKNILCVGRLDVWKIKGFDIILKIWANIEMEHPDWQLEIAGSGGQTSMDELKSQISKLGIESRVTLLGQVNNMQKLYRTSSIFALPSRMEGFPMALLEAMSQGCACVAFEVGGSTREMLNEECGIIVSDGDNASFQSSLNQLIDKAAKRENIGEKAKVKSQEFTKEVFAKNWMAYMNDVIKKYNDKNKKRTKGMDIC